jgi:DNA polymerase III subunit delta'
MSNIYSWQREIWQRLTQNLLLQLRCHALLLKGQQGIGKFDFARYLAKSMLCANPTHEHKACDACQSCGWFEQDGHPNYYQVLPEALSGMVNETAENIGAEDKSSNVKSKKKASQQISVDQIRKLTDFVYMSGHQHGYKIILIYPSEMMNNAAANALLKKLEEPPAHVLFILVTHHPQHLLPTIRSRCQQITMPAPDIDTSIDWLKQQAVNNPQACLSAAGLAPLTALQFSESELFAQHEQFVQQISVPSQLNPIVLADAIQQLDLSTVVGWLQKWCYDLVSYQTSGKIRYYRHQQVAIKALAKQIDIQAVIAYSRALNTHQQLSHHPLNARLFLEEIFVSYVQAAYRKEVLSIS